MTPSTFASAAAAGNSQNSPRPDTTNEWSRRPNGTTQTFRRPSNQAPTTSMNSQNRETSNTAQNRTSVEGAGVYIPPHRNGATSEGSRYSKDQLLDLYRAEHTAGDLRNGIGNLFMSGWEPKTTNGASSASWGRRDDQRDAAVGADACWVPEGNALPISLTEMTAEERELFSSINSPIKPPTQTTTKDGTPRDTTNRKTSISGIQNSPGSFGVASPSSRPGPRRRDTNETYPFPTAQPSGGGMSRYSRDESSSNLPPAALVRRRTDIKDSPNLEDIPQESSPKLDMGGFGLKRTATGGTATAGPSWAPSPTTTLPMGGAFGNFALSPSAGNSDKRPGFASTRGESRFKSLMKESEEEDPSARGGISSLNNQARDSWRDSKDPKPRALKDLFGGDDSLSGSAALHGAEDSTPPRMNTGVMSGIGVSMGSELGGLGDEGLLRNLSQQTPHRREGQEDTLSPTNTNPYQSPDNEKNNPSDVGFHGLHQPLPGLGGFSHGEAPSERNPQSAGGLFGSDTFRGMGALPGLGSSSAWTPNIPTSGTPTRDRGQAPFSNAFGGSIFSPVESTQSIGFPPSSAFPGELGLGRNTRIPGLMPSHSSDRSRSQESRTGAENPFEGMYHPQELGGLGHGQFSNGHPGSAFARDTGSPAQHSRLLEGMHSSPNLNLDSSHFYTSAGTPSASHPALAGPGAIGPQRPIQGDRPSSVGSASQPPHIRTMVMPDRMKWEYKDHNGATQGPFSGLEMHDWYKSGYFTPELQIKKLEDHSFEPLAHLIRRIGNSREPFLVPQIGVAHDLPTHPRTWQGAPAAGVVPPFASSFPSFGTTLTAEQQNDLERRKQESQYLMARQKEHLAQQQSAMRMQHGHAQPPPFPQQLNHQQSSQSLHSQPSFGNMGGAFALGLQGLGGQSSGGPLDHAFRGPAPPSGPPPSQLDLMHSRESQLPAYMDRMNLGQNAGPLGPTGGHESDAHAQQVAAMLNDRARLQMESEGAGSYGELDQSNMSSQMAADRLQQFRDLREEMDDEHVLGFSQDINADTGTDNSGLAQQMHNGHEGEQSMTEQVQAAVSAKAQQPHNQWQRMDIANMQPIIPPPQSSSPMPAPIAQRTQNVADKFATSSPSPSPALETSSSSVAPWAKEAPELPKASLKEIQEAEAKKAARQEGLVAQARRIALDREITAAQQREQLAAQTLPGLPSSANWASSPVSASGNSSSVWAKAGPSRATAPPTAPTKKTLQQIQKEEEARKQKAIATVSAMPSTTLSSGKRYAELASKTSAVPNAGIANGGAWTTVGAGGKTKTPIPAGPAAVSRSVSGSITTMAATQSIRPKQAVRSTTLGAASAQQSLAASRAGDAIQEVKRWAVRELNHHLNKGINVPDFVDQILSFPADAEILIDVVHGSSQTLDSRHFTEEFIRRRRLADKGISAESNSSMPTLPGNAASAIAAAGGSGSSGGGWSEVAKKSPSVNSDNSLGSFKVVAPKKKGLKR